jgi:hypothetical protein
MSLRLCSRAPRTTMRSLAMTSVLYGQRATARAAAQPSGIASKAG